MKKRNILVLAGSLALVAAIGVGSTLAYFTDTESATNNVTMGNVNILLTETSPADVSGNYVLGEEKEYEAGLEYTNIVPGDVISKDAKVTVADTSEKCYVRVKIEAKTSSKNPKYKKEVKALINDALNLNEDLVKGEDGYYYYQNVLDPDDEDANSFDIFTTVSIPTSWGNEAADKSFEIYVTAEAIQAKNVDDVLTYNDDEKIIAWDGVKVKVEKYNEPTTSTTSEE